ncbi:linalool dehydratase-isomerase precursor, partial [Colletotrichum musicola]
MATTTITNSASNATEAKLELLGAPPSNLPPSLAPDFIAKFPKLSREQAGHLRHFHNLVSQRDGE